MYTYTYLYMHIYMYMYIYIRTSIYKYMPKLLVGALTFTGLEPERPPHTYGVATISWLLKISGLFCRISSL